MAFFRVMSLFFVAFVLCSGLCASAESKAIEVDIAILGGNLPNVIISLAYHGPVIDLAVAEANVALAGKVNLNLKYVNVTSGFPCESLVDESDVYLSRWYYRNRQPSSEALTLIMLAGN